MLFGEVFKGDVITRIRSNPQLAPYLEQADYVTMVQDIQKHPSDAMKYVSDKRFLATVTTLLGLSIFNKF